MPVTGWLVLLSPEGPRQSAAQATLARDPRVALGVAEGIHLPLVATLAAPGDVEDFLKSALAVDGVVHCDLVFADLEHDLTGDDRMQANRSGARREHGPA